LGSYLQTQGTLLLFQAASYTTPPASERRAVLSVLQQSPVSGYSAFIDVEVGLLGVYRETLNPRALSGRIDDVWDDMRTGQWYAWLYAIHEAAELQAFADIGHNPFDVVQWRANWKIPHLRATTAELLYLRAWSQQLGMNIPELAIESEHPIRSGYAPHLKQMQDLQAFHGWPTPTVAERQAAQQFWQQIRR
jgi:hypothetical protein